MVQDQDIDVYLAPYSDIGKRYPEHVVPSTSPALSGNPNEVYIEVVDGDRFVIVVDLLAAFDWKGSKMLLISFSRDGKDERVTSRTSHYSQLARHAHNTPRLQGRDVIETDVRKVDGRWLRCGFKFSQLHIDEDMDMNSDQVTRGINSHGRIDVVILRGECIPPKQAPKLWNGPEPPSIRSTSKAIVKDNHVSHTAEHVILKDAAQPITGRAETWKRLPGPGGKPIEFTIRYRSRDVLQKLKIIPKDQVHIDLTGSPPASPKVKREARVPGRVESSIKQEPVVRPTTTNAHVCPEAGIAAETTDDTRTSGEQRDKKRKAVEDELAQIEWEQREVELEQRKVQLEQKRLRLKKTLGE